METKSETTTKKMSGKVRGMLLRLCLVLGLSAGLVFAATETNSSSDEYKLKNGSFEEGTWNNTYQQPDQSNVPAWNTTAYEGKIELFKNNKGVYIKDVELVPTDGVIAAELNADEESTLYQTVKTTPSSVYEWGLDHGARNGTDTMALVIGPAQYDGDKLVNPSKPSKDGRDQLMQMIDWLIKKEQTSVKTSAGLGERLTVYSKKFAANGTFQENEGNNAFSLTPSKIYTEEWKIWIIADSRAESGPNPWGHYGSNAEGSAGSTVETIGSTEVDMSKYYLYTVPAGQTETLFGFVSVGYHNSITTADKAKTYGNFLDNINFEIYHPLSGSSTTHGSAVVGGSDGTTGGEGEKNGHIVTVDNNLKTYVKDGEALKIQAVVKGKDALEGCEFVGVYYTIQEDGNPVTHFISKDDKGWSMSKDEKTGDITYTYSLEGIKSATDLHFIFIKSPTVTYDSNGGKPYVVERTYNTTEATNVYSFKPETDNTNFTFIAPYVSHAAESLYEGWKFMGWLLTGDTIEDIPTGVEQVNAGALGSLLLKGEHTIACNYSVIGAAGQTAAQYFKIFNEKVSMTDNVIENNNQVEGVLWQDNGEERAYANVHKGLVMVAQWRWLQAFIPQVGSGTTYTDSADGGTVNITSDKLAENYNDKYNETGGISYHATTNESITVEATANKGYEFLGWYDKDGNLLTTDTTYSYTETKESVNTYYARFSNSVTQNYIRQVKDGDTWKDTTDDNIGTLDRYEYIFAAGTPISSTATAGAGYKFVGWYDSNGEEVTTDTTYSYTTKGNATYYARFETAYTVNFVAQTKQANGSFKADNVGGKVSVASVKDVNGGSAKSTATANEGYKFLGWYDKDGNPLSTGATYSTTTTPGTNGVTYYARFEMVYKIENQVYLSFIAESESTSIPKAFEGRNAGTGKNAKEYGLDNKYGNTIATGFKYSIADMTKVSTIQITVKVPTSAYVKVGGTGSFTGKGNPILSDSDGVLYNKGSIKQISGATTLTYHWDASGLESGKTYGFIIDNLYAPGATATITVNGTAGTKVTNENGVVNTAATEYKNKSHYSK